MTLPPYYQRLIERYPQVSLEEWQLLDQLATVRYIRKGEHFLRVGTVARNAAFVLSGQFKYSFHAEDGAEKIMKFSFADDFLTNCVSFNNNKPSYQNITALEDSVILRFNIKKLQPLYDLHLSILHVNIQLYQDIMQQQAEHQYILSLKSPLERYKFLLKHRPMLIQKISLTNISRYLFTSREALSRARLLVAEDLDNQNAWGCP
ncbi:cAMP-binding domain of CRP or a regulatory subunit of cAMP-dependent protein kinases [Filimonas lacunae]|uniref:cAMP-binding domain of CRP or a regulatory subunit of cAMP-dependent protein kinases n=1 Tax=Filimonas lacunae TaxID=477680 RepID=A0A173MC16_9BACT|nr:Crp/Fnr family transcriptional regulator [Filimonas lacunae]BAV05008.1 Crp/Fnr family transcriptional regulator [Filimonas lacunae]SIT33661.1 cAMP-binding domain of CRP or a regulatory subunit of cAMP-dependent protein kinases [Filimonas lacunae]